MSPVPKCYSLKLNDRERHCVRVRSQVARYRKEFFAALVERDGGAFCVRCGDDQTSLEIDHVIPVRWGGGNNLLNLRLLCQPCNLTKGGNLD